MQSYKLLRTPRLAWSFSEPKEHPPVTIRRVLFVCDSVFADYSSVSSSTASTTSAATTASATASAIASSCYLHQRKRLSKERFAPLRIHIDHSRDLETFNKQGHINWHQSLRICKSNRSLTYHNLFIDFRVI